MIPLKLASHFRTGASEEETLREEDSQAYQVSVTGQHNIHCEVVNKEGNPCFGVMFEIDQGVPAHTSTPAGICCSTFIAPITDSF